MNKKNKNNLFNNILKTLVEMGFIIFLFYSNLLMGEYDKNGNGQKLGLFWAINDIFTISNFEIAILAAVTGYFVFQFLRKRV